MSRYRTVYVEVDIGEFSDEDIFEEAKERRLGAFESEDPSDITEMFYAFKLGRDDLAMELAKKIAQDHTGRLL